MSSAKSDSRDTSVARKATLIGAFSWGESDDGAYMCGGSFFEKVKVSVWCNSSVEKLGRKSARVELNGIV